MNIIEKLEALQTFDFDDEGEIPRDKYGYYVHADDIRAIIEEYKATEQKPVAWRGTSGGLYSEKLYTDMEPLFTHPQLSTKQ